MDKRCRRKKVSWTSNKLGTKGALMPSVAENVDHMICREAVHIRKRREHPRIGEEERARTRKYEKKKKLEREGSLISSKGYND
jgi:hypothetical protein